MKKSHVKFIGDIHGHANWHRSAIKTAQYTVQVGDLGFDYSYLDKIDSERHKFFGGNHDNYDIIDEFPHNIGHFGVHEIPDFGEFFFVRGAWSIDRAFRQNHDVSFKGQIIRFKNLWDEEEMTMEQCNEALSLYEKVKPKLLVSHTCPFNIVPHVGNPNIAKGFGFGTNAIKTRTNQLLQAMTDIHRPRMHIFGHFHVDVDCYIDGTTGEIKPSDLPNEHENFTRYVCLAEAKTIALPKEFVDTL